jgi:protein gp37
MADRSQIEWTETTWNPVTGCDKVSPGCDRCYAETLAKRLKAMGNPRYSDGFNLTLHHDLVERPHRWRDSRLVFVNSMSDLFHPKVPSDFIRSVFDTMAATPRHTYQVLTKRPKRVAKLVKTLPWPSNVWMGVSVEHQDYTWRVDDLRSIPAAVRFLSCEPLLGPLDLDLTDIHWVIAGGESGHGHRPIEPEWVRTIRDQCVSARVPFFFKQWGGHTPKAGGRLLDGHIHDDAPERHHAPSQKPVTITRRTAALSS